MRQLVFRILIFLLPIGVAFMALLFVPIDKGFAYHYIKGNCFNHGAWFYDRIFINPTNVDIAFIGSSRTLHAINERQIEEQLYKALGDSLHVLNLGYCEPGRDFQHSVLKDLLKNKKPRLVVIEITEDEQRSAHPSFPYVAKIQDILSAPIVNEYYFNNIIKSITIRLEMVKVNWLFGSIIYPINNSLYGFSGSENIVTEEQLLKNEDYWNNRIKRDHKGLVGQILDGYPLHYLEKSIQLLNENEIEFCFLFVPSAHMGITESVMKLVYEKDGRVLHIDPKNYADKNLWMDATHLNTAGADSLATQICIMVQDYFTKKN